MFSILKFAVTENNKTAHRFPPRLWTNNAAYINTWCNRKYQNVWTAQLHQLLHYESEQNIQSKPNPNLPTTHGGGWIHHKWQVKSLTKEYSNRLATGHLQQLPTAYHGNQMTEFSTPAVYWTSKDETVRNWKLTSDAQLYFDCGYWTNQTVTPMSLADVMQQLFRIINQLHKSNTHGTTPFNHDWNQTHRHTTQKSWPHYLHELHEGSTHASRIAIAHISTHLTLKNTLQPLITTPTTRHLNHLHQDDYRSSQQTGI